MEIAGQQIFSFLSQYGYWIMIPLMIVEGPAVTLISAALAALGAFNIWVVFSLSIFGDIIGDLFLYSVGFYSDHPRIKKIRILIGISDARVEKFKGHFEKNGRKIVFLSKATIGVTALTHTTAGIVKMPLKRFLFYTFLGGIVWSGFLAILGYFYGYLWREISTYIEWIGYIIFGVVAITILTIHIKSRKTANDE